MSAVGICRCEKVRDRASLRARGAHNTRTRPVANADTARKQLNRNLRPDLPVDVLAAFDQRYAALGSPKLRKNGVLGLEYVMTFSPGAAATIDPEVWGAECLRFVETRHRRENIVSAHLHLDERTPHVHIVAMPELAGALVVGPFMGNRAALIKLQDEFHARVSSKFGLARNTDSPSGRKHITPAALRAASQPHVDALRTVLAAIDQAAVPLRIASSSPPVSAATLLSATGREAFVSAVRTEAETRANEVIVTVREQAKRVVSDLHEIARESLLLKQENAKLRSLRSEVLRDIELETVAEHILGFEGRREGSSRVWETDLHKLVISGSKFKDFKLPQRGLGGGAIDLAMHLLQCPFSEAARVLAGLSHQDVAGAITSYHRRRAQVDTTVARTTPIQFTFQEQLRRYAEPNAGKLVQAREYLIRERGLDAAVVDRVIDAGDLWANKWGSCVFAHRNVDGELKGCSIRASNGAFKQSLGDKTGAWFGIGAPLSCASVLTLTESAIDALSLAELDSFLPGYRYISTSGQSSLGPLLAFGKPFVFAFDADDAGEAMARECASRAEEFEIGARRRRPIDAKDWNEALTQIKDVRRRLAEEVEKRERDARERERAALRREQPLARDLERESGPMGGIPRVRDQGLGGRHP